MYRWALENEKIAALIHEIQGDIESGNDVGEKLSELRQISNSLCRKRRSCLSGIKGTL